jgi:hypothetical protein
MNFMQHFGDIVNSILLHFVVKCYTSVPSKVWDQQVPQKRGGTIIIREAQHYTYEYIQ